MQINPAAIPDELKKYNQWVLWKYEPTKSGKPTKPLYSPKTGYKTSHNPQHSDKWGSFDEVVAIMHKYDGIGFVLTENDPYCVIDLDKSKTDHDLALQNEFWDKIQSYAETSPGGDGAHIWLKGVVSEGRKRYSTEIYSQLRYITVTGNTIYDGEIAENQEVIDELWARLAPPEKKDEVAPIGSNGVITDAEVISRAMNAANYDKFRSCWDGRWQGRYPSQSESDYALIDMLAFYTKDAEQIRRIFLSSPAGSRDKYTGRHVDYYINRMIKNCQDKSFEPPPIDTLPLMRNIYEQVEKFKAQQATVHVDIKPTVETGFDIFPEGLIGEIAKAIYEYSPRPVAEIALMGAIGFMAGICGRCYNYNSVGLNLYLLLVAQSGVGKEAMKDGIDMLYYEIEKIGVKCTDFRGPMKINSEQAILRKFSDSKTKSILSIYGEVAQDLKKIVKANNNASSFDLETILLKLYSASGYSKMLDEMISADKSRNTDAVSNISFSFLGQSVPDKLYSVMTEDMIVSGFLPRFIFCEYDGPRVYLNEDMKTADLNLISKLATLVQNSIMLNESDKVISVRIIDEAKQALRKFDTECDDYINSTNNNVIRDLWNRVGLNGMKLAALLAVGRNFISPQIEMVDVNWATAFVKKSVRLLISKVEEDKLGGAEPSVSVGQNQHKIMTTVRNWYTKELTASDKLIKRYPELKKEGIVPMRYIQNRAGKMSLQTLKGTIDSLIQSGELVRVDNDIRKKLHTKYNWANIYQVEMFMISDDYKF